MKKGILSLLIVVCMIFGTTFVASAADTVSERVKIIETTRGNGYTITVDSTGVVRVVFDEPIEATKEKPFILSEHISKQHLSTYTSTTEAYAAKAKNTTTQNYVYYGSSRVYCTTVWENTIWGKIIDIHPSLWFSNQSGIYSQLIATSWHTTNPKSYTVEARYQNIPYDSGFIGPPSVLGNFKVAFFADHYLVM